MDDLALRRPELRDVEREGCVRWWKDDKGYGRITADDGEVLFVSFAGLVTNRSYRELKAGERVRFVWRGGVVEHGRHVAEEVRVVGEQMVGEAVSPDADSIQDG